MKKYILVTLITVMAVSLFALPLAVGAQDADQYFGGNNAWTPPEELGTNSLEDTISGLISAILGVLGIIAVILILYGGFIWMTAVGNEDKVDKAKKLIFAGIIGLVIILSAYAIAQFVLSAISGATG